MEGIIHGGDLLMSMGGKAIGHCKTHSANFESETKDLAVKAPKVVTATGGLWKKKMVTGQSSTIDFEGMQAIGEDADTLEQNHVAIRKAWKAAVPVEIELFTRAEAPVAYCKGLYIIKSYKESNPADDTATYSCSLENCGEVKLDDELVVPAG